jgi:hypothetical protein
MALKIFSILMVFLGEAICIYSEMLVAKRPDWWKTFGIITLAGVPLLLGYHYGYRAFGSMWVMMVVSIVSILIVEPVLVLSMFKEPPTVGTGLGFMCGCLGLWFALAY